MTCPCCGGTLKPATFHPEAVRCVGHYRDGELVRGGCGHAERRPRSELDALMLLCAEHAVMVETIRELAEATEPEPWESGSPEHELASRTLALIEGGTAAGVGS